MAYYNVLNGETSNGKNLNNDSMYVSMGGTANNTTVNNGGEMDVLAGATATEILENGGYVTIFKSTYGESGPNVTFKKNTFKNLVLENNITTVLERGGNLKFTLEASGEATFTVYKKGQDKKGNDTLDVLQTTKIALAKGADKTECSTLLRGLEAGEYYVSMAAKNTKPNDKGSVFYNVTATLEPADAASLAMPETDVLASASVDVYLDPVQDKLFGESGNGLLASL